MEKQYFYENDYYYSFFTEGGVEYKFFAFNWNYDIKSQLEFVHKHAINELSIGNTSESNVEKIIDFIKKNEITVYTLLLQNLTLKNIDFLHDFQTIKNLTVVAEVDKRFNFNELIKLQKLELFMGKYFTLEDVNKNVTTLRLHKANLKSSIGFAQLKHVKNLNISQSTLTEINGLEGLKNIEALDISYFPKLKNIEPIKWCQKLKHLKIKNCKSIIDWGALSENNSLKTIIIENCAKIKSLEFLKNINIEEVCLIDTQIEDGNVSWLLGKNIKKINFPVHKHYDLKYEELLEYQQKIGQRKHY
ncbi:MAG: hypothetical protein FWG66_15595 [Spirochaetes bacterium]|nr:hypothetical protein [Spirochaetota bacterium]